MKARFLGYVSCDVNMTEKEAFILVREHFGSPESLKTLFQEVHVVETHLNLVRRIGAVLAISLGVGFVTSLFSLILNVAGGNPSSGTHSSTIGFFLKMAGQTLSGILLLWGILLYWGKRMARGEVFWFHRMGLFAFMGLIGLLFLLDTAVPFLNINNVLHIQRMPTPVVSVQGIPVASAQQQVVFIEGYKCYPSDLWILMRMPGNRVLAWNYMIIILSSCLAWLWWCDVSPRRMRFLLFTAASWFAYSYFLQNVQPRHALTFDPVDRQITSSIYHTTHEPNILPPGMLLYAMLLCATLGVYAILRLITARRKVIQNEKIE